MPFLKNRSNQLVVLLRLYKQNRKDFFLTKLAKKIEEKEKHKIE